MYASCFCLRLTHFMFSLTLARLTESSPTSTHLHTRAHAHPFLSRISSCTPDRAIPVHLSQLPSNLLCYPARTQVRSLLCSPRSRPISTGVCLRYADSHPHTHLSFMSGNRSF
ncbi:hypothetical protein JB92DRAFT_229093 [Gautieria morchelliformis]|nr:hypothetical protein JB92DRAFT_229093 [Gautieria morchelliformis]